MRVLLSINPQYADKIFSGEKIYEYRRNIFKNTDVKIVLVYATSPIKKIIGEFYIEKIVKDSPENLWELSPERTGIERDKFDKYFLGKKEGYAIKIGKMKKYHLFKELKDFGINQAPQSFQYL